MSYKKINIELNYVSYDFELNEGLAIAWRAIRANKIRAALTMLGIFIGITAVCT
ncbi:MAG: hypothetical protein MZV64_04405 [Ignavibacteriales bacterium]|nr:hypothetical protein [Ignavibacteriales bacterium]